MGQSFMVFVQKFKKLEVLRNLFSKIYIIASFSRFKGLKNLWLLATFLLYFFYYFNLHLLIFHKIKMGVDNSQIKDEMNNTNNSLDKFQISQHLLDILEKKRPLNDFKEWLKILVELFDNNNDTIKSYIKRIDFLKNKEVLSTEFFRYCNNTSNSQNENSRITEIASYLFHSNLLGPICFLTPEIGRWSTIGGIGVMIDELSQGLKCFGQDIYVISPYYNKNKKGQTNYLDNDPFNIKYIKNICIDLDNKYEVGIHHGEGNYGIKYYFLSNQEIFPKAYPDFNSYETIRAISLFSKASLQLLCDINIIPGIIITNDWFTGLASAFAKSGQFGETFKGTKFVHIIHNLEQTYEGRIYLSQNENFENIYKFNSNWLIDPNWEEKIINPSRCAIMISDQWCTVSNSYKNDLKNSSALKDLLNEKKEPFAFPNGIKINNRLKILAEKTNNDRKGTKKYIQTHYFGYGDLDLNVPVFSFIGRLTSQKGVDLILDSAEYFIQKTTQKINILVGGVGNQSDPYYKECVNKINYLKEKYPNSFWANPNEFFTDGPAINLGSDFGLMPSVFEPGGLVQHEFFVAGTPVIAHRTGGLKDTVFEFNIDNNSGNGIVYEVQSKNDFNQAVERSLNLFYNKEKYEICRKNAKLSTLDVSDVSRGWCKEFYRLQNKIFFNVNEAYKEKSTEIYDSFLFTKAGYVPVTFEIKLEKKAKEVKLSGSFDNWFFKYNLNYDSEKNNWSTSIMLNKGKYFYKYIVDGDWTINENNKNEKGEDGMLNNVIEI